MENVSKAIGTILKANTGVTNIVGHGNIFHARIPQNNQEDTVLRFYVDDVDPVDVKNHSATMFNCFVRIEMYSNNDQDLTELATEVREALDRYAHGEVNGVFLAGVQFLRGKHYPDEPDMIDEQSYVQMYKFRVDIHSNVIVMNYSLTEAWTGDYWTDGTTKIYEITVDHGASTGAAVEMASVLKGWTVFGQGETFYWDNSAGNLAITGNTPAATGTTGWVISIPAGSTQAFTKVRYMKLSIEP